MTGFTRISPAEFEARGYACRDAARHLEEKLTRGPESSVEYSALEWKIRKLKADASRQYAEAGKRRFGKQSPEAE